MCACVFLINWKLIFENVLRYLYCLKVPAGNSNIQSDTQTVYFPPCILDFMVKKDPNNSGHTELNIQVINIINTSESPINKTIKESYINTS